MRESGYYPPGAEFDPNAPWNQIEPPEMQFDGVATVVLNKMANVYTDKVYNNDGDWELCDDVNAHEIWNDNYMDIPKLLNELVKYIDKELECNPNYQRREELLEMKDSAQDWVVIDEEYDID